MFPVHFGLEASNKVPLCTECKSFVDHSQCTNCSTPHDSIHEQPLNNLVPMDVDNDVSTTSWLAPYMSQSILSSSLNHDISSPSPDVDLVLSNGTTENILSSIHEVGEAEDSFYDDEYLSDDEPLVHGFIGIRVVPEGSSVPEQLARRAIAQGVFLERVCHSDESRQPQHKTGNPCDPRCRQTENPWTRTFRPCSPDGRRNTSHLTNLGEDDEDDFMEDLNIDSFEPFQHT